MALPRQLDGDAIGENNGLGERTTMKIICPQRYPWTTKKSWKSTFWDGASRRKMGGLGGGARRLKTTPRPNKTNPGARLFSFADLSGVGVLSNF